MAGRDPSPVRRPRVVVFAAFRRPGPAVDETTWWERTFAFDTPIDVRGLREPLRYDTATDVALCVTGVGHVEAATSVAALLACPTLDCSETVFLTVGVAGAPPSRSTIGAVFLADAVVDWDQKYRLDTGEGTVLSTFPFKERNELCKRFDPTLVETARAVAARVPLADSAAAARLRADYPDVVARGDPFVAVGSSVSGSEFWHGAENAAWADRACAEFGISPYRTTEMEGFATALALERFGHLDRYLSVRAASNFDRPAPGRDAFESLASDEVGLALAAENAFRVGVTVVDALLADAGVDADVDVPHAIEAAVSAE
ncbi:phosphorylase [Salinigranum rubrum]|uniref:Phosphorylase n=1 Tax=Salinigranum rubrum TaxID=755307 RepID=A0A2I8VN61_9EURY|nr:phosphorylase [Salinigranum rubrum]AUV83351.1 phosphorylase [Salinigranum rubrum]